MRQLFGQFGANGSGDAQFTGLTGIAIDTSGNIYTNDENLSSAQKFSSNGCYLLKFSLGSGNGQ
jgi:ABC-type antimicrobial peptide transport system ATPase subunit